MSVDIKTVEKLADLSKLEFDEASKKELVNDLNRILGFIDKLNELDTENVEPLIYMNDEKNSFISYGLCVFQFVAVSAGRMEGDRRY